MTEVEEKIPVKWQFDYSNAELKKAQPDRDEWITIINQQ